MLMHKSDDFFDIRPYHDSEVGDAVTRLLESAELLALMSRYKFPFFYRIMPSIATKIIAKILRKKLSDVDTVATFQQIISQYLDAVVNKTISDFTCEGLDKLSEDKAYLFLCNHRDIAMDPALVNYSLYQSGAQTSRIAIGDNLLNQSYVEDLMRLNKSFIVKRSVKGRREKMQAFQMLSRYISQSINDGQSVWLAQREGRAKNGVDKTDAAIIKMLFMDAKKQKISLEDFINDIHIVPVCISYEIDPCDKHKALELFERAQNDTYDKDADEDLRSIVTGIKGNKGQVTVRFGDVLQGTYENAQAVAEEVDRQITRLYELYPINYAALKRLSEGDESYTFTQTILSTPEADVLITKGQQLLTDRLAGQSLSTQNLLLQMYAAPVIARINQKAE
jgi:glycerol-3-phosphate O-acyltransferase